MKISSQLIFFYLILYLTSAGIVSTCIKVWKNNTVELADMDSCEDDTAQEEDELKETKLHKAFNDFSLEQVIATGVHFWCIDHQTCLPATYTEILSPPPRVGLLDAL